MKKLSLVFLLYVSLTIFLYSAIKLSLGIGLSELTYSKELVAYIVGIAQFFVVEKKYHEINSSKEKELVFVFKGTYFKVTFLLMIISGIITGYFIWLLVSTSGESEWFIEITKLFLATSQFGLFAFLYFGQTAKCKSF